MNSTAKGEVFVGMSGGVDSSVSAALLKEEGYDVNGVFIKVWQADFLPCNWREERRDAMRAAATIGIPFTTLNLEDAYKKEVVDYMIREYGAGRIPNPDVMCNKYVKFGAFYQFAKKHGAGFIATGHYARKNEHEGGAHLLAGVDTEKDQSYFLWTIDQEVLTHTLFPVGRFEKKDVRARAEEFGLPNADKKDSQGLCFMGKVDMADFLKHYLKTREGNVLNEQGEVIGTHDGAMLYTIGQRKGFSTKKSSEHEEAYFVVSKNVTQNTITVAHRSTNSLVSSMKLSVSGMHLINQKNSGVGASTGELTARIRYRGELFPVHIPEGLHEGQSSTASFSSRVEGIASGQSIVFYKGNECVGGAVIEATHS